LLQLGEPAIAAALAAVSDYKSDPLGRINRTLGIERTVRFARADIVRSRLDHLERVHSRISGVAAHGLQYSALDPSLQLWVLATDFDTTVEIDRRFIGLLDSRSVEQFYDEQLAVFDRFSIPARLVPARYHEFREWFDCKVRELRVGDDARELAIRVVSLSGLHAPGFVRLLANDLTSILLPESVGKQYGFEQLPRMRRVAVDASAGLSRSVHRIAAHVPLYGRPWAFAAIDRIVGRWLREPVRVAAEVHPSSAVTSTCIHDR
jgi:uncharacterized protein (DUF2236 family)